MWSDKFTYVKNQFYIHSKSPLEVLSELNEIVTKDSIDAIWPELPFDLRKIAHKYMLGTTSTSFNFRMWENMWKVLIVEDFQFQPLLNKDIRSLTIQIPMCHQFVVHSEFVANFITAPQSYLSKEFQIQIPKGIVLIPTRDYMVSEDLIYCLPLNYQQFQENSKSKILPMGSFDSFLLKVIPRCIAVSCFIRFRKVSADPN